MPGIGEECAGRRSANMRLPAAGERKEKREKLMRYAIIAGNRHATLLYALTYPERFDKARPVTLV